MVRLFILLSFTLFATQLVSQSVKINITNLPANHPFNEDVFIAGSFNNWNPGDTNHKMTLNPDNTYSITLNGSGTITYKFTRGTWPNVEKGASCEEISNRTYTFGNGAEVNNKVLNWADLCGSGGGSHTAQSNVALLDEDFAMPQLNKTRRIWIYLPPDYASTNTKYPVLYMQDGQNLFDDFYSYSGEWGIDEALNSFHNNGDKGCIVIGIDNGGSDRIDEYSPWVNNSYGGGQGDLYARFLVETLKPYIDQNYRTLTDRANTGIMGSSMGALIAFYTGLNYQDVFSKIGIFSPSFWFSDSCYTFARNTSKNYEMKLYFLGGGQEQGVIQNCVKMIDTLKVAGYSDEELILKGVATGQHSEWFWKQEFPDAYSWLYNVTTDLAAVEANNILLYPNPTNGMVYINLENRSASKASPDNVIITDILGRIVTGSISYTDQSIISIDLIQNPKGIYLINLMHNNSPVTYKVIKN